MDGEREITVPTENTQGKPYNGRSEFQTYSDAACKTPAEDEDPAALFIRSSLIVAPAGE